MFDIAPSEFLLIALVAIVVIGPKDLPLALRTLGKWTAKMRAMSSHFRTGLDAMIREAELEEMERKWREQNAAIMAQSPGPHPDPHVDADGNTAIHAAATPALPAPDGEVPDHDEWTAQWSAHMPADDPAPPAAAPRAAGCRGAIMTIFREIDDSQAPLLDHLIELRARLVRSVVALAVAFGVCFAFADRIFAILVRPLMQAFPPGQGKLIYTKLYEAFFVNVKVALFAAFLISFPIIANQMWAFIAPGLYAREKKAFLPFLIATPVLFTAGASLAYFVVMPTAFHWFLGFQGNKGGLQLEALPGTADYLSLVMQFILAFGISFLLPVLLMLLNRAGIVSRAQLVRARRYVIVGITIVAAVATPPDVVSQLMLAVPLWILFESTLVVMRFSEKRDAARAADEVAAAVETVPEV